MEYILKVNKVEKTYGRGANRFRALKNINFTIKAGEFVGIMGPSGAVKSTLLNVLATGSIIFFKMLTEAEEDKNKYAILYKIGVSEQAMKKSIHYQVGLIFVGPLLLGLMHGTVALLAFSNLLDMNLVKPVLLWMLIYVCKD